MICPKCGKDAGEANYCPECGNPLSVDVTENSVVEPMEEQDKTEEVWSADIEAAEDNKTEEIIINESEQNTRPLKKSKKKLYAIVAVVVVVIATVITVLFVQSRKIDFEREIFESYWVNEHETNTFSFGIDSHVKVTDSNGSQTFFWEKVDDNKIQISQFTFLGKNPFMTLEMVRYQGKIALKWKTDKGDMFFFKTEKEEQSKEETTTERAISSESETTTQKEYPAAEHFDFLEVMTYELNNKVKRDKLIEEVCAKRYVFYLEVGSVDSEHTVHGQLYPNKSFKFETEDDKQVSLVMNDLGSTRSSVTFDEEIWETVNKGDKIVIEANIASTSNFKPIGWSLVLENAVIVSYSESH